MPTKRHYGVTIDLDEPTTGVITNHVPEFLGDAICDGIDLAWEEHRETCKGECNQCRCNHEGDKCSCSPHFGLRNGVTQDHAYDPCEDEHDGCGPDERGDVLIGSWKKDADGKWEPDPDAEGAEYAAIVREIYTQVVWSKTVVRVRSLCSPCFPGQADVDHDDLVTEGGYLAYDLPADMYGDHE